MAPDDTARPDPLDVLRQPATPLAPRPAFARELRVRLEAALGRSADRTRPADRDRDTDDGGPTVPTDADTADPETTPAYVPAGSTALTPYLAVDGAREAIAFYQEVFGAVPDGPLVVGDDGRVGHAELRLGGARLMLADEYPEIGVLGPNRAGGASVMLNLYVADADAVVAAAVEAGAELLRPVEAQPYGDRSGQIVDPWGHRWSINTKVEDVAADELADRFRDEGFESEPPDGRS